jgi:RNA polymerase sigma factor (sigma-70 family)
MLDDSELLSSYSHDRNPSALRQIVERHIDFVYSAALRQTGDPHFAQDITQAVFVLFAQRAWRLKPDVVIKGWLFNTARFVIANARRADSRRRKHEQEAAAMRSEIVAEGKVSDVSAHLDEALAGLAEKDRRVLLLRYFENLPITSLGELLGVSENAAQKRVTRALERVKEVLVRRGASVTGASVGGVLASSALEVAPAHLARVTVDVALHGNAANSVSVFSLAKGAAREMIRVKAQMLAIPSAVAATCIATAVIIANGQPRSTTPPAIVPAAAALSAVSAPAAGNEDYDACCQIMHSIVDAYDKDDLATAQSLFYYPPGSDPKIVDGMYHILKLDVADYHLVNSAIGKFGMHGSLLVTEIGTDAALFQEILSRVSPGDARLSGDTLTITPPSTKGPNFWSGKPLCFVRVQGVWKLDASKTFRVITHAHRVHPVAGETEQQAFAVAIDMISQKFEDIADDIDQGRILDVVDAQRHVREAWIDLDKEFREFGCNTAPK